MALLAAVKNGDGDEVRRLMLQTSKFGVKSKYWLENNPLHCACEKGHLVAVRVLVSEYNADPEERKIWNVTPLHCAAENGHLNVVRMLISEFKVDCSPKDLHGLTPLHYACKKNHVDVVRALVSEFSAVPNLKDKFGRTSLHHACEEGHLNVVRILVSMFKADLNIRNTFGHTPLLCATKKNHVGIVQALVSEFQADQTIGDNFGCIPLHFACVNRCLDTVKVLVSEYKANSTPKRDTPLHRACKNGDFNIVKVLVSKFKADQIKRDDWGCTPLLCACKMGNSSIVRILVSECHEALDIRDGDGRTPMHHACKLSSLSTVRVLIEFKASLTVRDKYGQSPLHYACESGISLDVVKSLCKHGADVNVRNHNKDTPLLVAANNRNFGVALSLICEFGCDPNIANKGRTVLHHACRIGSVYLVRTLICEHKADVNARDEDNNLPLHNAASCGKLGIVLALIEEFNCNPSEPGHLGRTCLHMAAETGHSNVVQSLLKLTTPLLRDRFGDTPLHLASPKARNIECVKALVHANAPLLVRNSKGKTPVDIAFGSSSTFLHKTLEENKGVMQLDYITILEHAKKRYSGSHSITRVFVIGNPGAGKSSLIESLKRENFLQSFRKVSESSVPPHTAGIIPSVHISKQYGRVLFYDFAGDAEYYSSHAAIFESLASTRKGDNIFIVVVDLREDSVTIEATLHYWFSFVQYQKFSRPLFAVVGSHLDLASEQVSKRQLLHQFCTSIRSDVHRIDQFMLDCRDPRCNQIANFKQQLLTWVGESCKYTISNQASVLLGLLENDFSSVIACPVLTIQEHVDLSGVCLPNDAEVLHRLILELHEVGILLLLGDCTKDNAHVILDVSKLTNDVHELLFSQSAVSNILKAHGNSKTAALNIGIIPEEILAEILPPHITKECLVHLQYCQEIHHSDVGFFPALAQEAESTEELSFLFFPALCSVDKSQVPWDESTAGTSFSIGWLALCNNACDYFPPRFLHVLLLRLVFSFTLSVPAEQQSAHACPQHSRRCSMWKKGVHWLMEEGAEFMVELVNGSKGVIILCKGYGREETCAGIFTQVVSCVLQAKAEFCHSIQPLYFFVDSGAEADYLSEDHQFLVSDVERGLARGNEITVSVGNGRGKLELSKLKCMRKLTHWNSLFPMNFTTVLDTLRDVVTELYQLGVGLGAPRGVLAAIEADFPTDVKRRKRELVEWWMSSSEDPPCWWHLVQALKRIDYNVLAKQIMDEHGSCIELQEKILNSTTQALKPDEEFLHSLSGVVGSRWPSLAVSLALSEEEIEGLKGKVGGSQQELALEMLKTWALREEATYGHLSRVLKTVSLLHHSN